MLLNAIMKLILICAKIYYSDTYEWTALFLLWDTVFLSFIVAKLKTMSAEMFHGTHLAEAGILLKSFG